MKITLKLPDWCEGENLFILSRNELVAHRYVGKDWKIKKRRCNKCGRCCMVHPKQGAYFPLKEDGSCIKLVKDGKKNICSIGMEKPLACVLGEPTGKEREQFKCAIRYRKAK